MKTNLLAFALSTVISSSGCSSVSYAAKPDEADLGNTEVRWDFLQEAILQGRDRLNEPFPTLKLWLVTDVLDKANWEVAIRANDVEAKERFVRMMIEAKALSLTTKSRSAASAWLEDYALRDATGIDRGIWLYVAGPYLGQPDGYGSAAGNILYVVGAFDRLDGTWPALGRASTHFGSHEFLYDAEYDQARQRMIAAQGTAGSLDLLVWLVQTLPGGRREVEMPLPEVIRKAGLVKAAYVSSSAKISAEIEEAGGPRSVGGHEAEAIIKRVMSDEGRLSPEEAEAAYALVARTGRPGAAFGESFLSGPAWFGLERSRLLAALDKNGTDLAKRVVEQRAEEGREGDIVDTD